MEERYTSRLPKIGNFDNEVCKNICSSYSFGELISYQVIETGYEDFNFILKSSSGDYFVKLFSKDRNEIDCKRIVDLIIILIENYVHHPKIHKDSSGSYIHKINIDSTNLFLVVMDFIDGHNFFELGQTPNKNEIKQLAKELAHINSILPKTKIPHIYDTWAVPNFAKEYNKKKKYLKESEIAILKPLVEDFLRTDFDSLPKSLVHGDILKTNVIKDKSGVLWIVDFSVANLYPRILEIAIITTHLLFDVSSRDKTIKNLKVFLDEYGKIIKLNNKEKEALPKFIKFSYGIEYLNTIFEERVKNNKSLENRSLREEAETGLGWGELI